MKIYKNRYGDEYWFENTEPNKYRFVMPGNSMKYCRFGGREMQEGIDDNDLGMFDPSGGPYVGIGSELPIGIVKQIQLVDDSIILTVE